MNAATTEFDKVTKFLLLATIALDTNKSNPETDFGKLTEIYILKMENSIIIGNDETAYKTKNGTNIFQQLITKLGFSRFEKQPVPVSITGVMLFKALKDALQ